MLVESKDGSSALLGRPKKLRPGVLTCLSGFIEQVGGYTSAASSQHCRRLHVAGNPAAALGLSAGLLVA